MFGSLHNRWRFATACSDHVLSTQDHPDGVPSRALSINVSSAWPLDDVVYDNESDVRKFEKELRA